jgi:hypothetical protein
LFQNDDLAADFGQCRLRGHDLRHRAPAGPNLGFVLDAGAGSAACPTPRDPMTDGKNIMKLRRFRVSAF